MTYHDKRREILDLYEEARTKLILLQTQYPHTFEKDDLNEILKKHDQLRGLVSQKTEMFR